MSRERQQNFTRMSAHRQHMSLRWMDMKHDVRRTRTLHEAVLYERRGGERLEYSFHSIQAGQFAMGETRKQLL